MEMSDWQCQQSGPETHQRRVGKLTELMTEITDANLIDLGVCTCELLARYGLPCKHHLLQAYQTGQLLPRSLLHPRWWLDGPEIKIGKWLPSYAPQQELVLSPKRNDIAEATLGLLEARETLGPDCDET